MDKSYTIVKSQSDFSALISHINSYDYFAFDTETTGLNVRKDTVIGLSISGKVGEAYYLPLLSWNKDFHCLRPVHANREQFLQVLQLLAKKDLLMWNASYDIRIVKNNFAIDLTPALLADVMLMKHTVDEEGDFGLKKVAISLQSEIGLNVEEEANAEQIALKANVVANGGSTTAANYEMFKADLDVMGLYAAADADLTLRLGEYFRAKLEEEGLEEFFYDKEVMPLYKYVTIKMEEMGVRLDLSLILKTREEIVKDMAELEKAILDDLNAIPEVQEYKRAKALEMYPPSNKGGFAQALCEYFKIPLPKTAAGRFSITAKTVGTISEAPIRDFLKGDLLALNPYELENISWELFCKNGHNEININSKPQMAAIVFDCLGIKQLSETKAGKPQFDDGMIQELIKSHGFEWAKKLSNYNKLTKILGTYIDRFLDAQEDGYYYFTYKQHGTISGRYSGDAQQLPRPKEDGELDEIVLKYVNVVRKFFIAEEGRIFIDSDYESLEPHVFSHVSGDEKLRDIFRLGHDFYSTIAIATEKLEGYSADKKSEDYLGKKNKPFRQKAKAYSLGIPYGMGGYALGMTLEIPTKEAEELVEGYLSGFPDLRAWMETSRAFVKENGYITSQAGRIRHLPKAKELYAKHKDNLLDFKYRQRLEWKLKNNGEGSEEAKTKVTNAYKDYKNSLNNCLNFQIQSLGASIINKAMILINQEFNRRGINAWICATIHDQAICNIPVDKKEECCKIVQDIMESSTKLSVQLKAPPSVATNWKEGH